MWDTLCLILNAESTLTELCLLSLTYRKMTELKSRKAIFVRREAPAPCQIWFTCKGYLIHTRFGYFNLTMKGYVTAYYLNLM